MPGRIEGTPRWPKCSLCGGVDLGNFGVIQHKRDCPSYPCVFCHLEVMPGEKRTLYEGATAHYDCAADFELDRIEDQEARRA
jgi:hypothetical protein